MINFKNFITGFFSFILSSIIYFAEVLLLLIFSIYSIFSYRTIDSLIQNIEIKQIINEINIESKLIENLYDNIVETNDKEIIDIFLSSQEIKKMFTEYITAGASFILTGNEKYNIKVNDLVTNTKEKFFSKIYEKNIFSNAENTEKIKVIINNVSNRLIEYIPEISSIENDINIEFLHLTRGIFSAKTIIVLIIIIIVLTLLIGLLRQSKISWLLWLGTTTFFSSLIGLVVAFVPLFNFSSITKSLPVYINTLINSGVKIISSNFFIIGLIYLIISISLFSLYYLFNLKNGRNANKMNNL